MVKSISTIYATTNNDKFKKAAVNLLPFSITLQQETIEMREMQTNDGEQIAYHKAEQAYQKLQKPVLVNDDTWSIPALRGFPSTAMKLCNDYLLAEDWLRLMHGVENRKILLISYYAFHDGHKIKILRDISERQILLQAQGQNSKSPCLEVISGKNENVSIAEEITAGRKINENNTEFWQELATAMLG